MTLFTAVVTGNTTNAADLNQVINVLNGTTSIASGIPLVASAANFPLITLAVASAPSADQTVIGGEVTGDAYLRAALYITAGGYGGFMAGKGAAPTAHLLAAAGGWTITESLTVQGTIYPNTTSVGSGSTVTGVDFGNGSYLATYGGAGLDLQLHSAGFLKLYGDYGWVIGQSDHLGWKTHAGAKTMELTTSGDLYVAAGTHTNTSNFPDTFDYAEVVPMDADHPSGTVVCPNQTGVFGRCAHPGCARAVIRSARPGYVIGSESAADGYAVALAGRMQMTVSAASAPVQPGDWLTSDGRGGVQRLAWEEEPGRALGYALGSPVGRQVWMMLRYGA